MKILFLKDVKGTAKRGDIKEAALGYFQNFLLPQGLAVLATSENITKIKQQAEKDEKTKAGAVENFRQLAEKIRGRKIEIKAKANPEGKFYASVSEQDVKAAAKLLGFDLSAAKIIFPGHLKEVGDYEVKLDFGHKIQSEIIILVRV